MTFKTFLNEKYIKASNTKEWELALKSFIPLKPSLIQDLEVIPKAFHVTDIENMPSLIKHQGQKKQIATFTKGVYWLADGAKTRGEILVELQGETSFKAPLDLYSSLSRNGYRWLEWTASQFLIEEWYPKINTKVSKYFKDHPKLQNIDKDKVFKGKSPLYISFWGAKNAVDLNWDGKDKADLSSSILMKLKR